MRRALRRSRIANTSQCVQNEPNGINVENPTSHFGAPTARREGALSPKSWGEWVGSAILRHRSLPAAECIGPRARQSRGH